MQETNFLFYTTPSGNVRLDDVLTDESIWLTQKVMAQLFSVGFSNIIMHLSNVFKSGELEREAKTPRNFIKLDKIGQIAISNN